MASHFSPIFLTENYVTLQVDPTEFDGMVGHGSYGYTTFWEGIPYQSRLLVRVPAGEAQHFTAVGGYSRIDDAQR